MKHHLTREEFLELWRTLRGFSPLRNDAAVTRSDGIDIDSVLMAEMDAWYGRLLREADESLLAPVDIASEVLLQPPVDGCITVSLPPAVVRLLRVKLSGWRCPAAIVTDHECNMALRQLHPYTRACSDSPVAVLYPGGGLSLYPAESLDSLETLLCVVDSDGTYSFDNAALEGISI